MPVQRADCSHIHRETMQADVKSVACNGYLQYNDVYATIIILTL